MSDKPSYLGLLNAISLAETRAYKYLSAWIETTNDPDVQCVLRKVAAREGEHGMAFAKRIDELGFQLRDKDDPDDFTKRMAIASSDRSDLKKFEKLGFGRVESDVLTVFDNVFADHTIDIRTGELLGRYIAEEFDTARLLRSCHEALKARSRDAENGVAVGQRMAALDTKVDALCRAVDELRQIVCAQTMPAENG
jgi:rubrerythrin